MQTTADFKWIASSFGGGWLIPLTDEARETYTNAFDGEEPVALAPIGGQEAWIVEPGEMRDVFADIHADGFIVLEE